MKRVLDTILTSILLVLALLGNYSCTKNLNEEIEKGGLHISLVIVSGNNQTVAPGSVYEPLRVRLVDMHGNPIANTAIAFRYSNVVGFDSSFITISTPKTKTNSAGYASTAIKFGDTTLGSSGGSFDINVSATKFFASNTFNLKVLPGSAMESIAMIDLRTTHYTTVGNTHPYYEQIFDSESMTLRDCRDNTFSVDTWNALCVKYSLEFGCEQEALCAQVAARRRNYEDAGVPFNFQLAITDVEQNIAEEADNFPRALSFSYQEYPSWSGRQNVLPPANQSTTYTFFNGEYTIPEAVTIYNAGVTRVWVSDNREGQAGNEANLYDATAVEIYVAPGSPGGVVVANSMDGPSYTFAADIFDNTQINRENLGAQVYGAQTMTATDTSSLAFYAAVIDSSGNYLRDVGDVAGDVLVWTTPDPTMFLRTAETGTILRRTNVAGTELTFTNGTSAAGTTGLIYRPTKIGYQNKLIPRLTLDGTTYTFEGLGLTVNADRPSYIRAMMNSCLDRTRCDYPNNDSALAGQFTPVEISFKDKFGNTCDKINGYYDTRISIERFNSTTDGSDPVLSLPITNYPNSSGSAYGVDSKGTRPIISYSLEDYNQEYLPTTTTGTWLLGTDGTPTIRLSFGNGRSTDLKIMFRDANYRPFVHVDTQTHTFNSGVAAIEARYPLSTRDFLETIAASTTYDFAGPLPGWYGDDDYYTYFAGHLNYRTNNPITIYRGPPKRVNLRYVSGTPTAICENQSYDAVKIVFSTDFVPNLCRGLSDTNHDNVDYQCGSGSVTPCQLLKTSATQTSYLAVLEDEFGNYLATAADTSNTSWNFFGSLAATSADNTAMLTGSHPSFWTVSMGSGVVALSSAFTGTFDDSGLSYASGSATSYVTLKVTPGDWEKIGVALNSYTATDSDTSVIVKATDENGNWLDATTDGTITFSFLAGAVPTRSLFGEMPTIGNTTIVNPTITSVQATLSPVAYSYDGASYSVYAIHAKFPKAEQSYTMTATMSVPSAGSYTATFAFAMNHGPLDVVHFHNNSDPTTATINYTTLPTGTNNTGGANEPIGYTTAGGTVFTFSADQNSLQICSTPYDQYGNICTASLGAGMLTYENSIPMCATTTTGTIISTDTASVCTFIPEGSKKLYKSSVRYRAAKIINDARCITLNFNKSEKAANTYNNKVFISDVPDSETYLLTTAEDTRPPMLVATWRDGTSSTYVDGTMNITIANGTYSKIAFAPPPTTISATTYGGEISAQNIIIKDSDDNLVYSGVESSAALDLAFSVTKSEIIQTTAINPPDGIYTFAAGKLTAPDATFVLNVSCPISLFPCSLVVEDKDSSRIGTHPITVSSGLPTKLDLTCASTTVVAGSATDCQLSALDNNGVLVSDWDGSASYIIHTPTSSTTTSIQLFSAGQADVNETLTYSAAGSNNYTFSFNGASATGITTLAAPTISVLPSVAHHLDFSTSPSGTYDVGETWSSPTIVARVFDSYNNRLWDNTTGSIIMKAVLHSSPTTTRYFSTSSTTTVLATSGIATFDNLKYLAPEALRVFPTYSETTANGTGSYYKQVLVISDTAAHVAMILDGQGFVSGGQDNFEDAFTGTAATKTAGSAYTQARIYITDVGFNVATFSSATFAFAHPTDDGAQMPASITVTNGISAPFAFTFYRAGSHTIGLSSAYCSNVDCHSSSYFAINPNTAKRVLVALPGQEDISRLEQGNATVADVFANLPPDTQVAGSAFSVVAYVTDQYHNLLSTTSAPTLTLSMSDSAYSLPTNLLGTVSAVSGLDVFTFTGLKNFKASTVAGVADKYITITSTSLTGTSLNYEVVGGTPTKAISLFAGQTLAAGSHNAGVAVAESAVRGPFTFGTCLDATAQVLVVDDYYNIDTTYSTGSATVRTGYSTDLVTVGTTTTVQSGSAPFVSGVASFIIKSFQPNASYSFYIDEHTESFATGDPNGYAVVNSAFDRFLTVMPNQTFTSGNLVSGTPFNGSTVAAGSQFAVEVVAVNACLAKVTNHTGPVFMTTSPALSASILPSGTVAMVGGSATFTFRNYTAYPEQYTIAQICDGSATLTTESACTANGRVWKTNTSGSYAVGANNATPYKVLTILPGQTYDNLYSAAGISGSPTTQIAGSAVSLELRLTDQWNNTITTAAAVTVSSLSSNHSYDPSLSSITFSAGIAATTFTNYAAKSGYNLSATFSGATLSSTTSSDYSVVAGPAQQTVILLPNETIVQGVPEGSFSLAIPTTTASTATAGVSFSTNAYVVDKHFNVATTYVGPVGFADIGNNASAVFSSTTFTSGSVGLTVTETKRTASAWTVTPTAISATRQMQLDSAVGTNWLSNPYSVRARTTNQKILVLLPGESLEENGNVGAPLITGSAATQTANIPFTPIIVATDSYNNRTTLTAFVKLNFTNDAFATATAGSATLVNGTAGFEVTNMTANTHPNFLGTRYLIPENLSGTVVGTAVSSLYSVAPGVGASIVAYFDEQTFSQGAATLNTALTPTRPSQNLGESFPVIFYEVDERFNVLTTSTTNITGIGATSSASIAGGTGPLVNGMLAFSATDSDSMAGAGRHFTFSSDSYGDGSSQDYVIEHGSIDHFIMLVNGQSDPTDTIADVTAGSGVSVKIVAKDIAGNTVTDLPPVSDMQFGWNQYANGFTDACANLTCVNQLPTTIAATSFTSGTFDLGASYTFYNADLSTNIILDVSATVSGVGPIFGFSTPGFDLLPNATIASVEIMNSVGSPTGGAQESAELLVVSNTTAAVTFYGATYDSYGNFIENSAGIEWFTNSALIATNASVTLTPPSMSIGAMTFAASRASATDDLILHITDQDATAFQLAWSGADTTAVAGENEEFKIIALGGSGTATSYVGNKTINLSTNAQNGIETCSSTTAEVVFIDANTSTAVTGTELTSATFSFVAGVATINANFKKANAATNIYLRASAYAIAEGISSNISIEPNATAACHQLRSQIAGAGEVYTNGFNIASDAQATFYDAKYDLAGNYIGDVAAASTTFSFSSGLEGNDALDTIRALGNGVDGATKQEIILTSTDPDITISNVNVIPGSFSYYVSLLPETAIKQACATSAELSALANGSASAFSDSIAGQVAAGANINLQIVQVDKHCNITSDSSQPYLYHSFSFFNASNIVNAEGTTFYATAATATSLYFALDGTYGDSISAGKIYNASDAYSNRIVLRSCGTSASCGTVATTTSLPVDIVAAVGSGVPSLKFNGVGITTSQLSGSAYNSTQPFTFSVSASDQYGNSDGALVSATWNVVSTIGSSTYKIPFILEDSSTTFVAATTNTGTYLILDTASPGTGTAFSGSLNVLATVAGVTNSSGTFTIYEQGAYSFTAKYKNDTDSAEVARVGEAAKVIITAKTGVGGTATNYSGTKRIKLNITGPGIDSEVSCVDGLSHDPILQSQPSGTIITFTSGEATIPGVVLLKTGAQTTINVDNSLEINKYQISNSSGPTAATTQSGYNPKCVKILTSATATELTSYSDVTFNLSTVSSVTLSTKGLDAYGNLISGTLTSPSVTWSGDLTSILTTTPIITSSAATSQVVFLPNIASGTAVLTIASGSYKINEADSVSINVYVVPGVHKHLALLLPGDDLVTESAATPTGFDCSVSLNSSAINTASRLSIGAGDATTFRIYSLDERCQLSSSPSDRYVRLSYTAPSGSSVTNYSGTSFTNFVSYASGSTLISFSSGSSRHDVATNTFFAAANNNVTVTLADCTTSCGGVFTTSAFAVVSDPAAAFTFKGLNALNNTTVIAGSGYHAILNAIDQYGNIGSAFDGAKTFTWSFENVTALDQAAIGGTSIMPSGSGAVTETFALGTIGSSSAVFTFYNASNASTKIIATDGTIYGTSPALTISKSATSNVCIRTALDGGGAVFDATSLTTLTADSSVPMYCATYDTVGNFVANATTASWSGTGSIVTASDLSPNTGSTTTFNARVAGTNIGQVDCTVASVGTAHSGQFSIDPGLFNNFLLTVSSPTDAIPLGTQVTFTAVARDADINVLGASFAPGAMAFTTYGMGTSPEGSADTGFTFVAANFTNGTAVVNATLYEAISSKQFSIVETTTGSHPSGWLLLSTTTPVFDHYAVHTLTGTQLGDRATAFGLTVDARDAWGNPAANSETFTLFANKTGGDEPLVDTIVNGTSSGVATSYTFSNLLYGVSHAINIRATSSAGTTPASLQLPATFDPSIAGLESFALDFAGLTSGTSGSGIGATVYAKDYVGNDITGVDGALDALSYSLSCSGAHNAPDGTPPAAVMLTSPNFANGVASNRASFTFYKAESFNLSTCSVSAAGTSGAAAAVVFTVDPGTTSNYFITTNTAMPINADGATDFDVILSVSDLWGNPIASSGHGDLTLVPQAASGQIVGTVTNNTGTFDLSAASSGTVMGLHYNDFGNLFFTLSSASSGSVPSNSVTFTFQSTAETVEEFVLSVVTGTSATAGFPFALTATAKDSVGNIITDIDLLLESGAYAFAGLEDLAFESPSGSPPSYDSFLVPDFIGGVMNTNITFVNAGSFANNSFIFANNIANEPSSVLSDNFYVHPGATNNLSFSGPALITAGDCNAYNLSRADVYENSITGRAETFSFIGASTGSFYTAAGCGVSTTTLLLDATDNGDVYYKNIHRENLTLGATFGAVSDSMAVTMDPNSTLGSLKILNVANNGGSLTFVAANEFDATAFDGTVDSLTFYSAVFDQFDNFYSEASATWSLTTTDVNVGLASPTLATSATLTNLLQGIEETVVNASGVDFAAGLTASSDAIIFGEDGAYYFVFTFATSPQAGQVAVTTIDAKTKVGNPANSYDGIKEIIFTTTTKPTPSLALLENMCVNTSFTNYATINGVALDSASTATVTMSFVNGHADATTIFTVAENVAVTFTAARVGRPALSGETIISSILADATSCVRMLDEPYIVGGEAVDIATLGISNMSVDNSFEVYPSAFDKFGNYMAISTAAANSWGAGGSLAYTVADYTGCIAGVNCVSLVGVKEGTGTLNFTFGTFTSTTATIYIDVAGVPAERLANSVSEVCDSSSDTFCSAVRDVLSGDDILASYYWDASGESWRTSYTNASWYTEASGTSSVRGPKKEFPSHAFIIGTSSGIDIVDAKTNKVWMKFAKGVNRAYPNWTGPNAITATDGRIYAGFNEGFVELNFKRDRFYRVETNTGTTSQYYGSGIVNRNIATTTGGSIFNSMMSLGQIRSLDTLSTSTRNYLVIGGSTNVALANIASGTAAATYGFVQISDIGDTSRKVEMSLNDTAATPTAGFVYFTNANNNVVRYRANYPVSPSTAPAWNSAYTYSTQISGTSWNEINDMKVITNASNISDTAPSTNNTLLLATDTGIVDIHERMNAAQSSVRRIITKGDDSTFTFGGPATYGNVVCLGNETGNTNTHLRLGDGMTFQPNDLSYVFRFMALSDSADKVLVEHTHQPADLLNSSGNFQLYIDSGNNIVVEIRAWNQSITTRKTFFITGPTITIGAWYSVKLILSNTNGGTSHLYVNGIEYALTFDAGYRFNTEYVGADTREVYVGADGSGNNAFHGCFDELAIINDGTSFSGAIPVAFELYQKNANVAMLYHFNETGDKFYNSAEYGVVAGSVYTSATVSGDPNVWSAYPYLPGDVSDGNIFTQIAINTTTASLGTLSEMIAAKYVGVDSSSYIYKIPFAHKIELSKAASHYTFNSSNVKSIFAFQRDDVNDYDLAFGTEDGFIKRVYPQVEYDSDYPGDSYKNPTVATASACNTILSSDLSMQRQDGWYWISSNTNGTFAAYCDMSSDGGGWTRVVYDNPQGTMDNVTMTTTTKMWMRWDGGMSYINGLFNVTSNLNNISMQGISHDSLKFSSRLYSIDSWDNENVTITFPGGSTQVYSKDYNALPTAAYSTGWNNINNIDIDNDSYEYDGHWIQDKTVAHSDDTASFTFIGTFNESTANESWAIDNIMIWIK